MSPRFALPLLLMALGSSSWAALSPGGVTRDFVRQRAARELTLDEARRATAGQAGRRLEASSSAADEEDDPVEQVHVMPGISDSATVVFLSSRRGLPSSVLYGTNGAVGSRAKGRVRTYAAMRCPTSTYLLEPPMGDAPVTARQLADLVNTSAFSPEDSSQYLRLNSTSEAWGALNKGCIDYRNPRAYWVSMYIHTVTLPSLEPGTEYTYRPEAGKREFAFTTPPAPGDHSNPLRIGMIADLGVTNVTAAVMRELLGQRIDSLFLVGDYSYADGWSERWDAFGVLSEPLMSAVPHLGVPGNHEISEGRYQGHDWEMRYPVPYESDSPWWYSYELGPVHVIGLVGSYAPTGPGSPQHEFLKEDLEAVDRARTPWVVVMFHTPWYNSNKHHYREGYTAQQDLEELLYEHGVDLVVNGHVHSYERSHPVYKGELDPCGPTHLVVGDGGNYEGPALGAGGWHQPQPSWSAFREASFGAGVLTVQNSTHAAWQWRRVACATASDNGSFAADFAWTGDGSPNGPPCTTSGDDSDQAYEAVDEVVIVRDLAACPSRALPKSRGTSPPAELPALSLAGASRPPLLLILVLALALVLLPSEPGYLV